MASIKKYKIDWNKKKVEFYLQIETANKHMFIEKIFELITYILRQ